MSLAQIRPALNALSTFLLDRSYCERARAGAGSYVLEHGTLFGCEHIEADDLESATEVYCESLPVIHADDPAWDADDGLWTSNDAIALYPPECDDDFPDAPDHFATRSPGYWSDLAADGVSRLPAVSGGSPEPEPFVPSEADWASYREWTEWCDRLDSLPDDDDE